MGVRNLGFALRRFATARRAVWLVLAAVSLAVCVKAYRVFWPHPISLRGATIEIVPMGEVDPQLLQAMAEGAAAVYGVPCRVASEAWPVPQSAYGAERGKYEAGLLLESLSGRRHTRGAHQLGVMDADITVGSMNFVFGYAQMPGSTAVMSLTRLRPKQEGEEGDNLLRERVASIAVHELGHTFGFHHCRDEGCVMAYTETAAGVDRSGRDLCERCAARLRL